MHACILDTRTLQTSEGVSWGGSCIHHLQGLKLGIYKVQGSRLWKRQGEGVESSQVPSVTAGRFMQ